MPAQGVPGRLLLLMAAEFAGWPAFVGTATSPQDQRAPWRRLPEVEDFSLCIDVLAGQCSGLVDELGCDGVFTGNSSSGSTLVRDVCHSSCSGCPCFNAYDDHSDDEAAQAPAAGSGAQLDTNSSEADGASEGTQGQAQRSPCNELIAQGTYSCASHFCTSCDFAGLCDLSCEFCKENEEPTPVCTNPYDDFQGAGACDSQISGGHMTCAEDFCETCTYAGFCVLSCGGCGTHTGDVEEVTDFVTPPAPAVEPEPATNSSAGQNVPAGELETADSWCLGFGPNLSNTKFCAHPLLWVSILPMTGALCGLFMGCWLGCRAPPRMRKLMATDVVGIRETDTDGDEIGGLEERTVGVSGQARGDAGSTAAAGTAAHQAGLRKSDRQLRTSGRRGSFASSASSSSVFTQSSSRVKHSRTRKWVQQNTANPVATDMEWFGSETGERRRASMVLRPEHAFDLETPPGSPPNELADEAGMGGDGVGTYAPPQLTPDDFLAVIDEMTDEEVAQSCREQGLLATVKNPRHHQLREALRSHYAHGDSTYAAAAPTADSVSAHSQHQHPHQHRHPQHHQRQEHHHSPTHWRRHQPPTLQPPQLSSRGQRRDPPPLHPSDVESQGQGQGPSRPVRQTSQWIL